ncbi:beta-galactosidase subunit beta [Enterococcus alcedinis]|uniref:Beta-galactosidase subunit beta n=2 Tax=Enterococcus alcedinis TaxID=1274384 RepID=A0A917N418_9ENTE|nr:YhcH/YjgK/YiaL family protein [Enterococcus alcedinis]MBP2101353.1 YhcH/YjgK/YiaL family protein [Enterococcus alcedinis]GGI65255.1 beta-galactosidase subunit beta [Enterococcus alcedinis]
MIYDTFENVQKYLGIHPNLDRAIAFIQQTDLKQLPLGVTEIEGQEVYVNIMEANLNPADAIQFEYHKKYVDIQFDLIGEEQVAIGFIEKSETNHYEEKSDFGTIECEKEIIVPLGENRFIICFTEEKHKPGIQSDQHHFVKKGVIKVRTKP